MTVNRHIGIDIRKEYSSLYSLRWEIERTFSILEEILDCENIWYTHNRSYDHTICLKAIAYNLMVISNILSGKRPRKIKNTVSCWNNGNSNYDKIKYANNKDVRYSMMTHKYNNLQKTH